jgi:hypothetical protein
MGPGGHRRRCPGAARAGPASRPGPATGASGCRERRTVPGGQGPCPGPGGAPACRCCAASFASPCRKVRRRAGSRHRGTRRCHRGHAPHRRRRGRCSRPCQTMPRCRRCSRSRRRQRRRRGGRARHNCPGPTMTPRARCRGCGSRRRSRCRCPAVRSRCLPGHRQMNGPAGRCLSHHRIARHGVGRLHTVGETLGYSHVLAVGWGSRGRVPNPPRFTVPGGRITSCVFATAAWALPAQQGRALSAPGRLALTRWRGLAGHAGCVARPCPRWPACHAGCVARQCRERMTRRGGSRHNSGRPRRRTRETRYIPRPSRPVRARA